MENNYVFIRKYIQNTEEKEGCSSNLYIFSRNECVPTYLTKTVLKRTSSGIFNMEKVDLEES